MSDDLRVRFGVSRLAPAVKAWLREGSPACGPLSWPAPTQVLASVTTCRALAPAAPAGPFGAVHLCEVFGVPLYLSLATADIIALHHDATLAEVAGEVADSGVADAAAFTAAMVARGSALKLPALRSLAARVADWPSWDPPGFSEAERLQVILDGLGLSAVVLRRQLRKNFRPLEFLAVDEAVLSRCIAINEKLAKLSERLPRVDLSGCGLVHWPAGLEGHPVEMLDVSGNPGLAWAESVRALLRLPRLRRLCVAGCAVEPAWLSAALPGIEVRAEPVGVPNLSADGSSASLRATGIRRLPPALDTLVALESLDVSGNPRLDWEDACTRLARLPRLAEVDLHGCGLTRLPPLHRIGSLRRLDLGRIHNNNSFSGADIFSALGSMPQLEVLHLPITDFRAWPVADPPVLPHLEELVLRVFEHGVQPLDALADWIVALPRLTRLSIESDDFPLARLSGHAQLEALTVRGRCCQQLLPLLAHLPRLASLAFDWHHLHADPDADFTLEGLRGLPLRALELQWAKRGTVCRARFPGLPTWLPEPGLMRFAFAAGVNLPTEALPAQLSALTTLRALHFELFFNSSAEPPVPLRLGHLPLERLELRGVDNTDLHLPTGLERLCCTHPPANLSQLAALQHLHIIDRIEAIAPLGALMALQTLNATWPLVQRLPTLPHLRALEGGGGLEEQPALTEAVLIHGVALPARLPAIRELVVHYGGAIEAGLKAMAGYPTLRRLKVGLTGSTGAPLPPAFAGLTQLDRLVLRDCGWKGTAVREQLSAWLPDCDIEVD